MAVAEQIPNFTTTLEVLADLGKDFQVYVGKKQIQVEKPLALKDKDVFISSVTFTNRGSTDQRI